jgi:hypothetical protein
MKWPNTMGEKGIHDRLQHQRLQQERNIQQEQVAGVAHRFDRRAARHRGAVAPPIAPSSVGSVRACNTNYRTRKSDIDVVLDRFVRLGESQRSV